MARVLSILLAVALASALAYGQAFKPRGKSTSSQRGGLGRYGDRDAEESLAEEDGDEGQTGREARRGDDDDDDDAKPAKPAKKPRRGAKKPAKTGDDDDDDDDDAKVAKKPAKTARSTKTAKKPENEPQAGHARLRPVLGRRRRRLTPLRGNARSGEISPSSRIDPEWLQKIARMIGT